MYARKQNKRTGTLTLHVRVARRGACMQRECMARHGGVLTLHGRSANAILPQEQLLVIPGGDHPAVVVYEGARVDRPQMLHVFLSNLRGTKQDR